MSVHAAFLASNKNPGRFREDAAFIYRCMNLAAGLETTGVEVKTIHWSQWRELKGLDLLVVHRPRASLRLRVLLHRMRRAGFPLIADVDDLIFDENYAEQSPGVLNGLVPLRQARALFKSHRKALGWFDKIVVSTEPLAEHARRLFPAKRVKVIPNAVHREWRNEAIGIIPPGGREKCITYFPGTRSHDRDFSMVREPLSRFLREHPDVKLRITGRLDFTMDVPPDQVVFEKRVLFSNYSSRVRAGWVNIAPLEATAFNRCKSALKVIEAGYWGIPTVCSPLPDAKRFEDAGALVASDASDWYSMLERLFYDTEFYLTQANGLRERIMVKADVDKIAHEWLAFATQR